jgi:hypothetical protein
MCNPKFNYLFGTRERTFLIAYIAKGIPTAINNKGETSVKTVEMLATKPVAKSVGKVIMFLILD